MTAPKAIVIGGGIGGLAAVVALRKVGMAVTVFERAPEICEVGAGLSLWSNAVTALRRLGQRRAPKMATPAAEKAPQSARAGAGAARAKRPPKGVLRCSAIPLASIAPQTAGPCPAAATPLAQLPVHRVGILGARRCLAELAGRFRSSSCIR